MGSYVSSFKKFMKSEEKKSEEKIGANPAIEEQADATAPAATPTATTTPPSDQPAPPAPASVESNPAVISARTAVTNAISNRDKVVAAKQDELNKLKAAQDILVNTANTNLNKALQDAAKATTAPTT